MRINRPKIPSFMYSSGRFGFDPNNQVSLFPVFTYFTFDGSSGISAIVGSATNVWEPVFISSEPGWIEFLALVGRNQNASLARQIGIRIDINGGYVRDTTFNLPRADPTDFEGGYAAVGGAQFNDRSPTEITGCTGGYVPFDTCQIDIYRADNTVLVAAAISVLLQASCQ